MYIGDMYVYVVCMALKLLRSGALALKINFVSVSARRTQSFLIYATVTHIAGQQNTTRDLRWTSRWPPWASTLAYQIGSCTENQLNIANHNCKNAPVETRCKSPYEFVTFLVVCRNSLKDEIGESFQWLTFFAKTMRWDILLVSSGGPVDDTTKDFFKPGVAKLFWSRAAQCVLGSSAGRIYLNQVKIRGSYMYFYRVCRSIWA